MTDRRLDIRPMPGGFRAWVGGMTFNDPLPDHVFAELTTALSERLVLVFRGHVPPTDRQLVTFARRFGPVAEHQSLSQFVRPDDPEVVLISNIQHDGKFIGIASQPASAWHTDYAW